jgi:hypothetical protein
LFVKKVQKFVAELRIEGGSWKRLEWLVAPKWIYGKTLTVSQPAKGGAIDTTIFIVIQKNANDTLLK